MTEAMEFLAYAISINALRFPLDGIELKSGRRSPYFFDTGRFRTGKSVTRLAKAYAGTIMGKFPKLPAVIFGPSYKGNAIAVATAMMLDNMDVSQSSEGTGYAYNRKEVKNHGEGGLVVGAEMKGKTVGLVDDVMTTGTSSGEAVQIVKAEGGFPTGCVIAFDRQERGTDDERSAVRAFAQTYNVPVWPVATLSDLLELLATPKFSDLVPVHQRILEYREQYGV
ncbi:orotate phosphoribosyltransferase [Candidatus Parcubacteria bacterium]|nr:orotate phosphoribosyltransferase [Candidatus Parcubacteria bacterium]